MLTAADLADLRAVAESVMVDTCTGVRLSGEVKGEFNEETLQYEGGTPAPTIYTGKCEIDRATSDPRDRDVAGLDLAEQPVIVKVPITDVNAQALRRGDVIKVGTCAHTPSLEGRVYTVRGIQENTMSTKRRLICTEGV